MKTKEMIHVIENAFGGTIDVDQEHGINGDVDFVAMFIDSSGDMIGANAVFKGFFTGRGKTKRLAIRNLYTTLYSITRNGVKQIGNE